MATERGRERAGLTRKKPRPGGRNHRAVPAIASLRTGGKSDCLGWWDLEQCGPMEPIRATQCLISRPKMGFEVALRISSVDSGEGGFTLKGGLDRTQDLIVRHALRRSFLCRLA